MAIPTDDSIKFALLFLLEQRPDGAMHCVDVYRILSEQFPELTHDEIAVPYQHSRSHWANRVQWVVSHLKEEGLILHHSLAGDRGVWALSPAGREWLARLPSGDELLEEMLRS